MIPFEAVVVMQQMYDMYMTNMEKSEDSHSRNYWFIKADTISDLVLEMRNRRLME